MEDERGGPYVTAYSCVSSAECRRAGIVLVLRPWWRQQAAAKWAGSRAGVDCHRALLRPNGG
jgi:hypothetical protein